MYFSVNLKCILVAVYVHVAEVFSNFEKVVKLCSVFSLSNYWLEEKRNRKNYSKTFIFISRR